MYIYLQQPICMYTYTHIQPLYTCIHIQLHTHLNSCQHTYRQSGERRPHHVAHSMVRENQSKTIFQHVLSGRGSKTVEMLADVCSQAPSRTQKHESIFGYFFGTSYATKSLHFVIFNPPPSSKVVFKDIEIYLRITQFIFNTFNQIDFMTFCDFFHYIVVFFF